MVEMIKTTDISIVLICSLIWGCASNKPVYDSEDVPTKDSRTYTTSFPTRDVSDQLKEVRESVKRISATGIYVTYFVEDRLLTYNDLETTDIEDIASRKITSNESTAGTAISIFNNNRIIGLLTNAHVVDFPDTLVSYVDKKGVQPKTFIRSVKIKKNQTNLIYDLPNVGSFEIVGFDKIADLALLRVNKKSFPGLDAPTLSISVGDPADLEWGSFVYIIGYPKGYPMITRGVVSDPERNDYDDFLTDALFNPGISGGLIMATRNNFRSFEWVGMTNTASADVSQKLVPDPTLVNQYEDFELYRDSIFVETQTQLIYGITQSIPIKRIYEFLEANEREIRRMGFRINRFKIPD